MGGSSTLVVSIISAFQEFFDLPIDKKDIAKLAYSIEREDMGIIGGNKINIQLPLAVSTLLNLQRMELYRLTL